MSTTNTASLGGSFGWYLTLVLSVIIYPLSVWTLLRSGSGGGQLLAVTVPPLLLCGGALTGWAAALNQHDGADGITSRIRDAVPPAYLQYTGVALGLAGVPMVIWGVGRSVDWARVLPQLFSTCAFALVGWGLALDKTGA